MLGQHNALANGEEASDSTATRCVSSGSSLALVSALLCWLFSGLCLSSLGLGSSPTACSNQTARPANPCESTVIKDSGDLITFEKRALQFQSNSIIGEEELALVMDISSGSWTQAPWVVADYKT